MCENAYWSIKNPNPSHRLLTSLAQLRFATSATFGLESNLIFRGLNEEINETNEGLKEKIYWNIADTIDRYDQTERLAVACTFTIRRCRRLGKPNSSRSRPVSVEFVKHVDADAVYEYRYHLTGGLYVDREFNLEMENSRRILRPILRAAKMKPEYRYKSRMENDKLVIDGKKYGVNDLNLLPQKLHPFEVTTKSNEETLGFFGELCPLVTFNLHNSCMKESNTTVVNN